MIPLENLSVKLGRFLKDLSFTNDATGPGSAQIVMLRGSKINPDGSLSAHGDPRVYTDRYDDTLVVFGQKSEGQPYLVTFKATAKPGLAWIYHKSYAGSGRGCPTVQPGQYPYCRGDHRGHEALRQAGAPVCVIRDLNQNARLENTDLVDYPIWTGINIHAGSIAPTVGYNSSGCQVLWGGWKHRTWTTFYDLIYGVAKAQKIFNYALVDFLMFGEWHDRGPKKWLMFGSHGDAVKALQERLVAAGYFGAALVDGKWGIGTDRAVRKWQKSQGLEPNGIVSL